MSTIEQTAMNYALTCLMIPLAFVTITFILSLNVLIIQPLKPASVKKNFCFAWVQARPNFSRRKLESFLYQS